MYNFFVLSAKDTRWSEIISLSRQYDFYHTQSYSKIEQFNEPVLCVAYHNNDFIAMPILIRKIEGTEFFDCTSVYGYCGPISNVPVEELSSDHIMYFQSELLLLFKKKHIISAFSRLHPFFNQTVYFKNFGIIKEINKTVAIDLRLSEEDQIRRFRKSTKAEIVQLKRRGYSVSEASTHDEIDEFAQIYGDSMKKICADPTLHFNKEYFYLFLNNPCFRSKLLLAKKEGKLTAGALFTLTNNIMQYHLASSKEDYLKDSPMKLIIDKARIIGIENKIDFLHLGGGVKGSSSDSLFIFKAGFSDKRFVFSIWQLVVDDVIYSQLVDYFNINVIESINFFPLYRAK